MATGRTLMTSATDLSGVITGDWCVGCGACTAVDGSIALELDQRSGAYRPSHAGGPSAAAVCPAVAVDIDAIGRRLFPDTRHTAHGAIERVWLAQSTDYEENLQASSGGVIKPVLKHALSTGLVDSVIALGEESALDYRHHLVTDEAGIDSLPGSIYHVVEHSSLYDHLRGSVGKVAIVGIPCQLEGLHLFLESPQGRPFVERVKLTVGLFCGWQYTMHAMSALGTYLRFDPAAIEKVAYRGGGPVGKLRISLSDGSERTLNRRVAYSAQVAFDRSFNLPRCHVCVNHSNMLADIAVGDAWLPESAFSRTGVSLVIARTSTAAGLLEELAGTEQIRLSETTDDVIERSQGRPVAYGDSAYSLLDHLADQGVPHPEINGPNRGAGAAVSPEVVAKAWLQVEKKRALQRAGRYRWLWLRKATVELPALLRRLMRSRLIRRYLSALTARGTGDSEQAGIDGFV